MSFRLPKDVNNLAAAARDLGQSGDEENNFAVPNLIVDTNGNPIRSDNPLSVQVENQKEVQDVQLTGRNVEVTTVVDAVALTKVTNYQSSICDPTEYKSIEIYVTNTHDVELRVGFRLPDVSTFDVIDDDGNMRSHNPYSGSSYARHTVPPGSRKIALSRTTLTDNAFTKAPFVNFLFPFIIFYQPTDEPTEGSVTFEFAGVKN